jgi:wyosine [tRNA(Phe)-imidazoG37] synthetase (radical SAM superfamily)
MVQVSYYSPWKAVHHQERLEKIKAGQWVAPSNIQIDLEGYCPHSCQFCSYRNVGWQAHGMTFDPPKGISSESGLPRELALSIPRQMREIGCDCIEVTGGGESLASPYICEFFDTLAENEITPALITNGVLFSPRVQSRMINPAWVRVSLDAASAKMHSVIHRTPVKAFDRIMRNIEAFISTKPKTCKIGASFIITPDNYPEIEAAGRLYKDMGFDSVRFAPTYEPTGTAWMGDGMLEQVNEQLAEVHKLRSDSFDVFGAIYRIDYYNRPNNDFHACHIQRFVWAIGTDARVYPCCIEKYHDGFEMGDLHVETLREIAERHARTVPKFDVTKCKPCYLRDKNQFIQYILEDDPAHVGFV